MSAGVVPLLHVALPVPEHVLPSAWLGELLRLAKLNSRSTLIIETLFPAKDGASLGQGQEGAGFYFEYLCEGRKQRGVGVVVVASRTLLAKRQPERDKRKRERQSMRISNMSRGGDRSKP